MEEILASIKRVIAEDGRAAGEAVRSQRRAARPEAMAAPIPDETDDVLELGEPMFEGEGLLSADAAAASRQKLAALSAMRDRGEVSQGGEGPLEALIREMLRPMLKEWLDQNLPEIVERLVTREIGRITGKSF